MTDLIKAASAQQKPQLKTDITQQPQHFFTVSTFKLIVMLVATLGLYDLYWSYKNWVFIKHKTGRDISPFWRTVFGILWIYSFFKYIKLFSLKARLKTHIYPGFWVFLYIVLSLIGFISNSFVPSFLLWIIIIRCNIIILNINRKIFPNFQNNTKYSLSNYIVISIGGIIWLLIIYGLFSNDNLSSGEIIL
jgi:hypothetical protein